MNYLDFHHLYAMYQSLNLFLQIFFFPYRSLEDLSTCRCRTQWLAHTGFGSVQIKIVQHNMHCSSTKCHGRDAHGEEYRHRDFLLFSIFALFLSFRTCNR
uniref:Uncharacterized protein n=1 Tax=Opuntia streptacantha TaxID=393608 RepID=A0A7C8ZYW6_OPUST